MARAVSIWVVMSTSASLPVGVFTVKHEMRAWCQRERTPDNTRVYRYGDGSSRNAPLVLSLEEVFE